MTLTGGRNLRTAVIAIGLLALVARVVAALATDGLWLSTDPAAYDLHARTLVEGGQYPSSKFVAGGPSALRPPGYPYFLAGVYEIFGSSENAGRMAQAVLGALIAVLVLLIATELFGFTTGVVAGLLTAVFPPLVMDGMTLFTEPLFVVLELFAVYAVLRWRRDGHIWWAVGAGVATGLGLLTRPNALAVLIVLAFAARGAGPWRRARKWLAPAVVIVCALLVVAPWTIRNAVAFDAFVPVSTQDGFTLLGTYNEKSRAHDGMWFITNEASTRVMQENPTLNENELTKLMRKEARDFALDHPGYVAEVAGRNTLRLFNLGGTEYERNVAKGQYGLGHKWGYLMTWSLIPILVLALIGAFMPAARAAPKWIWAIPVLLLSTVFVLAANRHRAGIDPFLLMLAALALTSGWQRLRRVRSARA